MNNRKSSAVALSYSELGGAPRVTARGQGIVAERIIKVALENNVFVHESPELLALLSDVDLDQQIPEELYAVIAELLVWVHKLECDLGAKLLD